jgi:hypothetical protein
MGESSRQWQGKDMNGLVSNVLVQIKWVVWVACAGNAAYVSQRCVAELKGRVSGSGFIRELSLFVASLPYPP